MAVREYSWSGHNIKIHEGSKGKRSSNTDLYQCYSYGSSSIIELEFVNHTVFKVLGKIIQSPIGRRYDELCQKRIRTHPKVAK